MDDVIRFRIGAFQCSLFRDLTYQYLVKDFFTNADASELSKSLKKFQGDVETVHSPFVAVLLEAGDRKILIDTGVGFMEEPLTFRGNSFNFRGNLHHLFEQQNVDRSSITDVIISHFHPDHIGGNFSENGIINFPNARFHIHEDEWNFWHSSGADGQPPVFGFFIEKNITSLKDHHLNLYKGDFVQLLPGITAVKAKGHTPGQVALLITSEEENLLYISDAFLHPLHLERPDWETNFDYDRQTAKKTRIKLLDLAYRDNLLVQAFHFDFPGMGRIIKPGVNWKWEPIKINKEHENLRARAF